MSHRGVSTGVSSESDARPPVLAPERHAALACHAGASNADGVFIAACGSQLH